MAFRFSESMIHRLPTDPASRFLPSGWSGISAPRACGQPALGRKIDFRCVTYHEPLQAACPFIQAWKAYKLAFNFFPIRQWIDQEAVILVDCRHHLAIATGLNPLPVTGRNGQTPFGVQSHFGSSTKHDYDEYGIGTDRAISALTHLLPLFSTLYQYSRGAHNGQHVSN